MRRRLLAVLLFSAPRLLGQSTEADLNARLLHQPLYLRGQWRDDKLHFDPAGKLLGDSQPETFTLAGIDVRSLKLDKKGLRIDGDRIGLTFNSDVPAREKLKHESIRIEIDAPAGGDYTAALDAMFTSNLADFVPAMSSYWKRFGEEHFGSGAADVGSAEPSKAVAHRIAGKVSPPIPISTPEVRYSWQARSAKLSGKVVVYLQVNENGGCEKIRILHPLGLGLDEMSVAAVAAYRFKPALEDDSPVRVEMNVEVNFVTF